MASIEHTTGSVIRATLYYSTERNSSGVKITHSLSIKRLNGYSSWGQIDYKIEAGGKTIKSRGREGFNVPGNTEKYLYENETYILTDDKLDSGSFVLKFTTTGDITNFNHSASTTIKYDAYSTKCGAPTNPMVSYNGSSFTVSGKRGTDGTNNSAGGVEIYWKWDSSTVTWTNYDDCRKFNRNSSNNGYSFVIDSNIPSSATSIAVIAYTIDNLTTDPSSGVTVLKFSQITASPSHIPFRYYFSNGTKLGFKQVDDSLFKIDYDGAINKTNENYISWSYNTPSNYKATYGTDGKGQPLRRFVNTHIVEPGYIWHSLGTNRIEVGQINLNTNKQAQIAALLCMKNSNCGLWYNGDTVPWAKYLDTTLKLESYIVANNNSNTIGLRKNNNTYNIYDPEGDKVDSDGNPYFVCYYIGTSETTLRVELSTPPFGINAVPNAIYQKSENEDWGYESNKFTIHWNAVPYANQYLLTYSVGVQNNVNQKSENKILLKGDNGWQYNYDKQTGLNEYTLSIPSLLAGQQVWFNITPIWYSKIDNVDYTYTAAKTTTTNIVKQGGIIAIDKDTGKSKNYHVYVADKNGNPIKTKAVYVFTDKMSPDNELTWKLCKMPID